MRLRLYHVGLIKEGKKLIIQARESKDFLSPNLTSYLGARYTTKENLRSRKQSILELFNMNRTENLATEVTVD